MQIWFGENSINNNNNTKDNNLLTYSSAHVDNKLSTAFGIALRACVDHVRGIVIHQGYLDLYCPEQGKWLNCFVRINSKTVDCFDQADPVKRYVYIYRNIILE